ncbi:hypothetical protein KR009_000279, partial [Drosophila setifemur]
PLVACNGYEYALAFGGCTLRPARHLSEVALLPTIVKEMHSLGLSQLFRLQAYTWPHLLEGGGRSAMIVSAPRSGRTLGYMPPLCQAVHQVVAATQEPQLLIGPLAVIVVPYADRVRRVSAMCEALLGRPPHECFTPVLNVPSAEDNRLFSMRLLNGVGCLVATPGQLHSMVKMARRSDSDVLRFPYLRFIAFDDVDLISLDQLKMAQRVLVERLPPDGQNIQVVMVSQTYNHLLMRQLQAVSEEPVLVFGDLLEAALYGGVELKIIVNSSNGWQGSVVDVLHDRRPNRYRTVIFCQNDEGIRRCESILKAHGLSCLPYYQTSGLQTLEQVSHWIEDTRGDILVCTDECPELNVRQAQTLIHFGMGGSWSKFKMRHLFFSENLKSAKSVAAEEREERGPIQLLSMIFLDHTNTESIPRLLDFLQQHQNFSPRVLELAKSIRQRVEEKRHSAENPLCPHLLVLGECKDRACKERHHLVMADRRHQVIPSNSNVKFQMLRVYTPAHFCVLLLEYLGSEGVWKQLTHPGITELNINQLLAEDAPRFWPPVPGAVCIFHTPSRRERVRVLKVAQIENVQLVKDNIAVEVQAMDVDTRIFATTSESLLECSEELQQIPAMATDMRLVGFVPISGEHNWMNEDRRLVMEWMDKVPREHFFQANVHLATAQTLFVGDLVEVAYLKYFKVHTNHQSLSRSLVKANLAQKCGDAKEKILDFFNDGFFEDESNQEQPKAVETPPEQTQKKTAQDASLQPPKPLKEQKGADVKVAVQEKNDQEAVDEYISQLIQCMQNPNHMVEVEEKEIKGACTQLTEALSADEKPVASPPKESKAKESAPDPKEHFPFCKGGCVLMPPPNVQRPQVTYYQTKTSVKFQVILPEDNLEYGAYLIDPPVLVFYAKSKTSPLIYQFFLTLNFPCAQMRHHMQGRCVYIGVSKGVITHYPLVFEEKFVQLNHEMFVKMEEE